MEFKNDKDDLNFIEKQFATEPCINVITKKQFEERISKVFNIIWEKLSTSFGPGGSGTFISVYPHYYNTKDGFTIMKNIAFDQKLDQVICDMVMGICSRLNFTVGDGTTTATIATKSTYDEYLKWKNKNKDMNILPRDIIGRFEEIKNSLLDKIDNMSIPIRSDDPKELRSNIEKVVSISSNGDKQITEMISSLYEELMYPAISVSLAKDGIMKSSVINGYSIDISLTDKLYINNDENTMIIGNSDVIMFDHKVVKDTYELILKPLSYACKQRGRHLVCIAPFYDETALSGVISKDLNAEYKKNQDINLVLMVCSKATGYTRTLLDDLSMLLNTTIISSPNETEIISKINNNGTIYDFFDLDNRNIEGSLVAVYSNKEDRTLSLMNYDSNSKYDIFGNSDYKDKFRVGYCDTMNLGLKQSTFSGFYYDQDMYDKYKSIAKDELDEIQRKCQKIGTFNIELDQKQKRYYSLGLKTGLIEVGSTSEISQGYLKDVVDDSVKAAASAYTNGIVLGCNVTLLRALREIIDEKENNDYGLERILANGFIRVYGTVLSNVIPNEALDTSDMNNNYARFIKNTNANISFETYSSLFKSPPQLVHQAIIDISLMTNSVFDISTREFNKDVINSAETDKEILKATIDLLSLLITGAQLVLC